MDKREIITEIRSRAKRDHRVGIDCKNDVELNYCHSFNRGEGCVEMGICDSYKRVKNV